MDRKSVNSVNMFDPSRYDVYRCTIALPRCMLWTLFRCDVAG